MNIDESFRKELEELLIRYEVVVTVDSFTNYINFHSIDGINFDVERIDYWNGINEKV